jgi:hypothetical protein
MSAKVTLGFLVACCAIGLLILWTLDPYEITSPSDEWLLATFHDHRAALEKLRQMVIDDSGHEAYFSESQLDDKLGQSRRKEYKNLIYEIYSGLVVTVDYDKSVRFIYAGAGLSAISSGWLKGIQYVPGDEKKGQVVMNLDKTGVLPPGVYLRSIEPKWFVVYQKTD